MTTHSRFFKTKSNTTNKNNEPLIKFDHESLTDIFLQELPEVIQNLLQDIIPTCEEECCEEVKQYDVVEISQALIKALVFDITEMVNNEIVQEYETYITKLKIDMNRYTEPYPGVKTGINHGNLNISAKKGSYMNKEDLEEWKKKTYSKKPKDL